MYRVETTVSCYACNTVELSDKITIHVYDSHYKQFTNTLKFDIHYYSLVYVILWQRVVYRLYTSGQF